jgi:hypothetical protein
VGSGTAAGLIKRSSLDKVTVDTTVMPKAFAHPTDGRLLERHRQHIPFFARSVVTGHPKHIMNGTASIGVGKKSSSVLCATVNPQANRVAADHASPSADAPRCTAPAKHPKPGHPNTTHAPESGTLAQATPQACPSPTQRC